MYMSGPSDTLLMQPVMAPSMTGYYPSQIYPQASQVRDVLIREHRKIGIIVLCNNNDDDDDGGSSSSGSGSSGSSSDGGNNNDDDGNNDNIIKYNNNARLILQLGHDS